MLGKDHKDKDKDHKDKEQKEKDKMEKERRSLSLAEGPGALKPCVFLPRCCSCSLVHHLFRKEKKGTSKRSSSKVQRIGSYEDVRPLPLPLSSFSSSLPSYRKVSSLKMKLNLLYETNHPQENLATHSLILLHRTPPILSPPFDCQPSQTQSSDSGRVIWPALYADLCLSFPAKSDFP